MFESIQANVKQEVSKESAAEDVNSCKDPIPMLKQIFIDRNVKEDIANGLYPAPRSVFRKSHGIAQATFSVNSDLPDNLKIGVFKTNKSFTAWIRFSSDASPFSPDLKTSIGIGIKLFGVPGAKLLESDKDADTHDFILQNHDIFFVDNAVEMCKWAKARVEKKPPDEAAEQIRASMKKTVTNVLDTTYWSILPYAFGDDQYVKYKLEPAHHADIKSTVDDLRDDPNHLRQDLWRRLLKGDASFKFYLQLRKYPDKMPLDKATVRWEEADSEPICVARLTIPKQDINARGQAAYGENLSFNPWHALREHSPVGSIAEARKVIYQEGADLRRNLNGIPIGEPGTPRER